METTVTTKRRKITASDWLSWREQGMSNRKIAALVGISSSMACIIARKFRNADIPDLQYRKRKPGPQKIFDTSAFAYQDYNKPALFSLDILPRIYSWEYVNVPLSIFAPLILSE